MAATTGEVAELALHTPIRMHLTNTFAGKPGFQNTSTMMSFKNSQCSITYVYVTLHVVYMCPWVIKV